MTRRFLKCMADLKLNSVLGKASAPVPEDVLPVFAAYQEKLRHLGMLDLDDLEVETLRLFHQYPDIRRKIARQYPNE